MAYAVATKHVMSAVINEPDGISKTDCTRGALTTYAERL
jgi:hypothetical protein